MVLIVYYDMMYEIHGLGFYYVFYELWVFLNGLKRNFLDYIFWMFHLGKLSIHEYTPNVLPFALERPANSLCMPPVLGLPLKF